MAHNLKFLLLWIMLMLRASMAIMDNSDDCRMVDSTHFFGTTSRCDTLLCMTSSCACQVDWQGVCRMLKSDGRPCNTGYCSVCMCRKTKKAEAAKVLKLKYAKAGKNEALKSTCRNNKISPNLYLYVILLNRDQ